MHGWWCIRQHRLLTWGTGAAALAGIMLAIAAQNRLGRPRGLVVPLFVFISVAGFIVANSIAGALSRLPERAAQSRRWSERSVCSGIVASALVGILADGTPWPMGLVIAVCGLGSFASARRCSRNYLAAAACREIGHLHG